MVVGKHILTHIFGECKM